MQRHSRQVGTQQNSFNRYWPAVKNYKKHNDFQWEKVVFLEKGFDIDYRGVYFSLLKNMSYFLVKKYDDLLR